MDSFKQKFRFKIDDISAKMAATTTIAVAACWCYTSMNFADKNLHIVGSNGCQKTTPDPLPLLYSLRLNREPYPRFALRCIGLIVTTAPWGCDRISLAKLGISLVKLFKIRLSSFLCEAFAFFILRLSHKHSPAEDGHLHIHITCTSISADFWVLRY